MTSYAPLAEESTTPRAETREEVSIDLTGEAPPDPESEQMEIKISVTNGGAVLETFDFPCKEEDTVDDFKTSLQPRLDKMECKLRMLIYRGRVLHNGKKLSDYKLKHGDTLQLLIWVSSATAAAAQNAMAAATQQSADPSDTTRNTPRSTNFAFDVSEQPAFTFQAGLASGLILQEEVERWAARVKVWTCMLMLIYSFKLLVGMSQSLEAHQQHSSELALSFLGFWVAYIGLRAATRFNFSLARGYFYGQMTVAMCNLFLMAIRDPSVTPGAEDGDVREVSANVLFISFCINVVFWAYIVYGAFRFQRALWMWLQDGAPEHIIQSQEEV